MTNPFQSPEVRHESLGFATKLLPLHLRFIVAVLALVMAGFVVSVVWRLIGFETPLKVNEVRHWLVFVASLALLAFCFRSARLAFPNEASVVRIAHGIIAVLQAVILATSWALELFIAWYSGVEWEPIALSNRAFGEYAWIWFLNPIVFCSLAILITINGIEKRTWLSVPNLILLLIVTLVNLRGSYFFNHTNTLPSSWRMFFLG